MNKKIKKRLIIVVILVVIVFISGLLWDRNNTQLKDNSDKEKNTNLGTREYRKFIYRIAKSDNDVLENDIIISDLEGNKKRLLNFKESGFDSGFNEYDVARNSGKVAYTIDGDYVKDVEIWTYDSNVQKKILTIKKPLGKISVWGPVIGDDGKRIFYSISDYDKNKNEVWSVNFDGTNNKLVKIFEEDKNYGCNLYNQFIWPSFLSADGKILYLHDVGDSYNAKDRLTDRKGEACILALNVENGETFKLAIPPFSEIKNGSFSNDKKKLVVKTSKKDWFDGSYNGFGILDLESNKFQEIFRSDNPMGFTGIKFSDDNSKIAYSVKDSQSGGEKENLYVHDLKSKSYKEIYKSNTEMGVKFYIGNKIVFSETPYAGADKLMEINDDGTEKKVFDKIDQLGKNTSIYVLDYLIK